MKYKIVYSFVIAAFAFVGMSLLSTPSAKAALDGVDGPVLYVEQVNQVKDNTTQPVSNVITSQPDGTNEVVAAATDTEVTAATISNPTSTGNYDIVYAQDVPVCNPEITPTSITNDGPSTLLPSCNQYNYDAMQQALNKVTVTADGNPTGAPTELVKLDPLFDSNYTYDTVYNLSYAPDSKSVVASRNTQLDAETSDDYRSTLEKVDTTTGEVTTLVGAYCDYFLRGGYGANGAIYFSRSDFQDANCSEYPESMNTNIWYIPAGSTEAQQLTFDNPDSGSNIDEYYIDASPDNKQLLIVDLAGNKCDYAGGVLWGAYGPLSGCTYYYLNLADGSLSDALDMNSLFVPKFFSTDNSSIIGTLYPQNLAMARSFDPALPSTAVALRSDLANPVAVTNLVGVQEWAPKIVAVVPTTTVTAPTLPNTGANSTALLAFAAALVALGGASLATSRRR